MALLEADVSFKVVKQFISSIQERAVGEEVFGSLTPGQTVIKIVTEELIKLMGSETTETVSYTHLDVYKRQIRRTVTLLKKYQLIEPLDLLDELSYESPFIIYPSINVVLLGDDVRELLADFEEGEEEGESDNGI